MTMGQLRRDIARRDKYRIQLQDQLVRDAVTLAGTEPPPFDPELRNDEILAELNQSLTNKQELMTSNVTTMITVDHETLSVYQARIKAEALRQLANIWDSVAKDGVSSTHHPWMAMGQRESIPAVRQVSITVAREHATRFAAWADRLSDAIESANWRTESGSPQG